MRVTFKEIVKFLKSQSKGVGFDRSIIIHDDGTGAVVPYNETDYESLDEFENAEQLKEMIGGTNAPH